MNPAPPVTRLLIGFDRRSSLRSGSLASNRGHASPSPLRQPVGNHARMPARPIDRRERREGFLHGIPADTRFVACMLAVTMLGLWIWWALSDGAFFGTVLLPGAVLLYAVLGLTIGFARLPIAPRGAHAVALAAFLGLAAWTALSLLWTPARDLAFDYAQRNFVYAAAFSAGLLLTAALNRRMILSVAPFMVAGAVVVLVVVVKVLTEHDVRNLVDADGTLDYPFGYRNANAGFFAMLAFGLMPIIARPKSDAWIRVGSALLAAASLSLVAVSQSRGSLLAIVAGSIVLLCASKQRGWALVALLSVFLPVILLISQFLDPYEAARTPSALSELQGAITAALEAGVLAALLTLGAIALDRRGMAPDLPSATPRQAWTGAAIGAVVLVAGFSLFVGNPITKISNEVDKVSSSDSSYSEVEGSRFTYAGGLNRINFWEVALDQFKDNPIQGEGAGSYRSTYLVKGDGSEAPRNAHSLPLETLGELGLVGLILLCVGFGASAVAAWRSRRLGPDAATISAVALVVAAVALAQASVDWSWYFGGQIAPMFALLGSAAAPAALALNPIAERVRRGVVLAAGLLAVIAVPTFASERLTLSAARNWRGDLGGAYGALSTATDLNPFADVPLLVEAQIAKESDDADRALDALAQARSREPDDWRSYNLAAQVLERSDPARALQEIEQAYALNPSLPEVKALRRKLQKATGSPDS